MFEKPLEIWDICDQNVTGWMLFSNSLKVIFKQFHLRYYLPLTDYPVSLQEPYMSFSKAFQVTSSFTNLLNEIKWDLRYVNIDQHEKKKKVF